VLGAYGIRVPRSALAENLEQALQAAEDLSFPVVMKIASEDIVHKSDVGGVKVGIGSKQALENAYGEMITTVRANCPEASIEGVLLQQMVKGLQEVIVGLSRDPVFGPVVLVGLGGVWVELLRDISLRICPVEKEDAVEMLKELKAYSLLNGFRGDEPTDVDSLVNLVLAVSRMGMDLDDLAEMDLNPVKVGPRGAGAMAVDYRIILNSARPSDG